MTTNEKIVFGAVVVVISLALGYLGMRVLGTSTTPPVGAVAGSQLAEHYIPYVAINQGYKSALPITTTDAVTASSTSVTGAPFCFEFYATSTNTVLHLVASTTGSLPNGAAATMTANYGTCN